MNKLTEIEKNYAHDLIKFFCEEYIKMYKDDFTNIRFMIGRQIQQRLCDKGLIIDFMVKMENLKLDQTRDIKLSRILDENNDEVISTIIVDFKLNKFTEAYQVRHNITIEDLSK